VRGRRPASPTPRFLPCATTSRQRQRVLEASRTQRSPEDWWERPGDLGVRANGGPVLRRDAQRRAGIWGTTTSSRSRCKSGRGPRGARRPPLLGRCGRAGAGDLWWGVLTCRRWGFAAEGRGDPGRAGAGRDKGPSVPWWAARSRAAPAPWTPAGGARGRPALLHGGVVGERGRSWGR
jgi:hypothetical protein